MNVAGTQPQRLSPTLKELVGLLPELYQPIYGHPELSLNPSRVCEDRLAEITKVCLALSGALNRPLRILDLGCAQGYMSLRLAELGAIVVGVDIVPANLVVCHALALENPDLKLEFISGAIEVFLRTVDLIEFDLILGLSVFHHLIHSYGIEYIKQLLGQASLSAKTWLFEFALPNEPTNWASSQPKDIADLTTSFAFSHELCCFPNHLSPIQRPLIFASNLFWYFEGKAHTFDTWSSESHKQANSSFLNSRKYYQSEKYIVKYFSLDCAHAEINANELTNESIFLTEHPDLLAEHPQLVLFNKSEKAAWLVRESIPGQTLAEYRENHQEYDQDGIVYQILSQLVALEAANLYHNDLRLWNVLLLPKGGATLIDFGAITPIAQDGVWPQNLVMGFWNFISSVCSTTFIPWSPNPAPFISPFNLPERYRAWALSIWHMPPEQWSFHLLLQKMHDIGLGNQPAAPLTAVDMWMREIEEYLNKLNAQHMLTSDKIAKAGRLQFQQTSIFQSIIDSLIYNKTNH